MMNYNQALEYIDSFLVFGSKPGLERIRNLLNLLGNPQKKLKFIHVAGTNGKGSVCAYLSCILQHSGRKTGMFVSPFVIDYCERFQIDGKPVPHNELCAVTEQVKTVVDTLPSEFMPTEFEIVTAIGMMLFLRAKCDVVVLEVGLGGMYDSTNIIDTPLCSVIMSISLDHTKILGDTVEKIAEQKAGIIKQSGITVMYPKQPASAADVIESKAKKENNRLIVPNLNEYELISESLFGNTAVYKGLRFETGIAGEVQPLNAITAIEAVRAAFDGITDEDIICGIAAAKMPARCEAVEKSRPIIMDGAHNPDGVKSLVNMLNRFVKKPITAVIGMMRDKDVDTVLSELCVCFDEIYTVTVDNPRSMTADELAKAAAKYCGKVTAAKSVDSALKAALSGDNAVVICGSFYLMSEIK